MRAAFVHEYAPGETPLSFAAKTKLDYFYQQLNYCMNDLNILSKALLTKIKNGDTALHLLARHPFMFYLSFVGARRAVLLEALQAKNDKGETPLELAASNKDSSCFIELICNLEPKDQLWTDLNVEQLLGLYLKLKIKNSVPESYDIQVIAEMLSPEYIDSALEICSQEGDTLLHSAVKSVNPKAFITFIKRCSPEILLRVLQAENKDGDTPLHLIARNDENKPNLMPAHCIDALIHKLSADALFPAFMKKNNSGHSALHIAAKRSLMKDFYYFLNNLSPNLHWEAL